MTTRYYGWYANRPRGIRRRAASAAAHAPVLIVTTPRIVACITQAAAIGQILTHLRTRAAAGTVGARPGARSPPSPAAAVARRPQRRLTVRPAPLHAPGGS